MPSPFFALFGPSSWDRATCSPPLGEHWTLWLSLLPTPGHASPSVHGYQHLSSTGHLYRNLPAPAPFPLFLWTTDSICNFIILQLSCYCLHSFWMWAFSIQGSGDKDYVFCTWGFKSPFRNSSSTLTNACLFHLHVLNLNVRVIKKKQKQKHN